MARRGRQLVGVGLAVAALLSCSSQPPPDQALRSHSSARPSSEHPPVQPPAVAVRPTKVLLVVEENKSHSQAMRGMPHLASLARRYGHTTAYRAATHPSLPNYLALVGGSTFGVTDNGGPAAHPVRGPSVFDQAIAAGHTAKSYVEAMPGPCATRSSGTYAVKHNPWPYFADVRSRANCRRFDVPSGTPSRGALINDIGAGRLPDVGMLVPDLCNDAHDCSLARADAWLKRWLPAIMAGPDYRSGRLVVVVTFDEDDRSAGNRVLTVVIAPGVHRKVVRGALTHYSWTRYAAELTGSPLLGGARGARSLGAAFGL